MLTITSNADGIYSYTINNIKGNISVSNGTANIIISNLAIDEYSAIITFYGNENYTNASIIEKFKIIAPIQSNENINMFYLDGTTYSVIIYGTDCKVISGSTVTFTINKKTYNIQTNSTGYAVLPLNIKTLVPGTYSITVTYNSYSVVNTVKVKQIITAKKTTKVKKTASTLKIKITLKGKSVLKQKTMKVKFKGKTYTIKTNKKGVAYFKLSKKVIKKLKKGKTYSYKISYNKDNLKRYIYVRK